jgi:hypothetical protein
MRLFDFFAYYALLNAKAKNLPDSFGVSSVSIMIGTMLSSLLTLIIMLAAWQLSGYVLIRHEGAFVFTLVGTFFLSFMATARIYGQRYLFILSGQFKPFALKKSAGMAISITTMVLSLVLCMATAIIMGVKLG